MVSALGWPLAAPRVRLMHQPMATQELWASAWARSHIERPKAPWSAAKKHGLSARNGSLAVGAQAVAAASRNLANAGRCHSASQHRDIGCGLVLGEGDLLVLSSSIARRFDVAPRSRPAPFPRCARCDGPGARRTRSFPHPRTAVHISLHQPRLSLHRAAPPPAFCVQTALVGSFESAGAGNCSPSGLNH